MRLRGCNGSIVRLAVSVISKARGAFQPIVPSLRCEESYPGALEVPNLVDRDDVWGIAKNALRTWAYEEPVYVPT